MGFWARLFGREVDIDFSKPIPTAETSKPTGDGKVTYVIVSDPISAEDCLKIKDAFKKQYGGVGIAPGPISRLIGETCTDSVLTPKQVTALKRGLATKPTAHGTRSRKAKPSKPKHSTHKSPARKRAKAK